MCNICFQNPCHTRCPNYEPPKATRYCSICGEGIYSGVDYVVNSDDEYAHYDCVDSGREMAEFLGYEIKCDECED